MSTRLGLDASRFTDTTKSVVPANFPEHIPNLLIMTLQIPRRNKPLNAPGGIIVLEDLQLGTNCKDAIDRCRIFSQVPIPKRKIQL